MILAVHQLQYLPWLGYFDKIAQSDQFVFLDCVQYKHREFQNRNKIRTQNGTLWLTVPVITKNCRSQAIKDVVIDNTFRWPNKHLKALVTNYSKAAYFSIYLPFFEQLYARKWDKLIELNWAVIEFILTQLEIKTKLSFESAIGTSEQASARIVQLCKKLGADTYLSGSGAKAYLDQNLFIQQNIILKYQEFKHPVYPQCFMAGADNFISNLSIVDLLFNHGPKMQKILFNKEKT